MHHFATLAHYEEIYTMNEHEPMRELLIAEHIALLEQKILSAKTERHNQLISDYCYGNGDYDKHTRHIQKLESQLAELQNKKTIRDGSIPKRALAVQHRLDVLRYKLESDGMYVDANTVLLAQQLIQDLTGVKSHGLRP